MNEQTPFLKMREQFPAYRQGVYMNHAAVSPFSFGAKAALESYWNQRSSLPVDIYPGIMEIKTEFKAMLGKLFNTKPDQIAIIGNTGHGLNIIASGFPFKKGDRIILNTMEFPTNIYPFMNAERLGVQIDWITPENGQIHPEQIENLIQENTQMVCISFVQFINGFKADMNKIGEICRKHDVYFIVDGIQGAGVCPLDLKQCHIDGFSSGGHKWLMWPMGTGFLCLSQKLEEKLTPAYAGWLSVKDCWNLFDYKLDFLDSAEKHEIGTMNFLGLTLAHNSLKKFMDLGVHNIYQQIISVTDALLQGFEQLGFDLVSSKDSDHRSGIVSIKPSDPEGLGAYLTENSIHGAVREGIVRFSPHCTNTIEDAEQVITKLKEYKNK